MARLHEPSTDEERALSEATPDGWYLSPLTMVRNFDPRPGYPAIEYEVEARGGREVGTRPHYAYAKGLTPVGRHVDVTLKASSVDALVTMIRALTQLDFLFAFPVDAEMTIRTDDD